MAKLLWKPSEERINNSNILKFMQFINERHGTDFKEYRPLYKWSVENIPEFWASFWDFADIKYSKPYATIIDDINKMPGSKWFEGARLNFAENLLRFRDDHTAFIFRGETQKSAKTSYAELYDTVARLAKSLRDIGIAPGDRVAAYMPNMMETAIAMLAATSIGATWASCATDIGPGGVLDRFGQIEPKV
ncbi:MAG: AMP-binding protein, partial [Deltaproteobacteria bacterium]|nr:AMP-binding protein [Deltaproteobacteria bacterium]